MKKIAIKAFDNSSSRLSTDLDGQMVSLSNWDG